MTRSDLSVLAVRLLGVYVFLDGFRYLPLLSQQMHIWKDIGGENEGIAYALNVWVYCLPLLMGLLLLVLSRPIGRWLLPRAGAADSPPASQSPSTLAPSTLAPSTHSPSTLRDVQGVVIATFGLLIVATTGPEVLVRAVTLQDVDQFDRPVRMLDDIYYVTGLVQVLVGVALVVGAGFLSRQINRFRQLGYPVKPNSQEPPNESPPPA